MDSESAAYSSHLKPSIANLIDNGELSQTVAPQPLVAPTESALTASSSSNLRNILNSEPESTPMPPTCDLPQSTSIPAAPSLAPIDPNITSSPTVSSETPTLPNIAGAEDDLDPASKKKRGRPRIHPDNSKQKRPGIRGRPRSETSQRALKEAAAAAAKGKSVGNNTISESQSAEASAHGTPLHEEAIHEIPSSENALDTVTTENGVSLQTANERRDSDVKENIPIKRKLNDAGAPESKPKPKKVKKEDTETKKAVLDDSAAPQSKLKSTSASLNGSPAVKSENSPGPTKRKKVDSSRRSKKPLSGMNGFSNANDFQDEESDVYCICHRGDNGEWMIACDNCDDWFHGSCVNLTEEGSSIVIKYVCPRCTKPGKVESIFKRKCRLPECKLPVEYEKSDADEMDRKPISKYCSKEHGVEFFQRLVNRIPSQQMLDPHVITAPQLVTLMNHCKSVASFRKIGTKFPSARTLPTEEEIEKHFTDSDKDAVANIQQQLDELEEKIKYNNFRTRFIQLCKDRTKLLNEELLLEETQNEGEANDDHEEDVKSKSKKKKSKQKAKKDICGYNSKLSLGDEEWKEYIESKDGQEALNKKPQDQEKQDRQDTCLQDKRKCPRHYGWQTLVVECAKDMERTCKLEQDKLKIQMSELYFKQQVLIMTSSSSVKNQTIAC